PLDRIGDVEDISDALEYILGAGYLTGQVISPNGGFVLQ
ncbi:MAG: short-chain dehydrogenase, partial [Methanobrevibacter sp.]|nr:short-chain dehydrogenase [Methanobrevibacter sp.]